MAIISLLLFIVLLPPSLLTQTSSTNATNHEEAFHSLILKACTDVETKDSCISKLRSELERSAHDPNPNSVLHAALKTTLDETRHAIDMISTFNTMSINNREQVAVEDCKELLDFSVSELSWSMLEMRKIREGGMNPHYDENLRAWLSAALGNQDTCLEGFEGTDRRLEGFVRGGLQQVTQLINNVLTLYVQLHTLPFKQPRNNTQTDGRSRDTSSKLPKWITDGDQELLKASPRGMRINAVVAQDGTGDYRSIMEAIDKAPNHSQRRYIIYVKKGLYKENIDMKKKKANIMLTGDGIGRTIVTSNRNFLQGFTTFRTATVAVSGKGFIARDMTFQNTAGPENHQAVALRVDSDQSAFYRCSIEGYQDTLYAHSLRQFYRECDIYGTMDFIFGNGAAVLQNCRIHTRVPLPLQKVTVTAQGRKDPHQNTGLVIQDSYLLATQPTYLGRPWKQYSRTVFINTFMSSLVQPRGWLEWSGNFALNSLWYGEYRNYGPGASLSGRVKWPGYHIIKDPATAETFTVKSFIDGQNWLPGTGVRFTAGLSN